MKQLALAVLLFAPVAAGADVVRFTCPDGVTEIDRGALTAVSSARPGETASVALIGRNLIEVLWTDTEQGIWEREMYAVHVRSKMTTGQLTSEPSSNEDQKYLPSVKCSDLEVIK